MHKNKSVVIFNYLTITNMYYLVTFNVKVFFLNASKNQKIYIFVDLKKNKKKL